MHHNQPYVTTKSLRPATLYDLGLPFFDMDTAGLASDTV